MWVSVQDALRHGELQTPDRGIGALLILAGAALELGVRFVLIERAGFEGLSQTKRLLITDDHPLITDGLLRIIRHPLYLGRITMQFGIALLCSSLWGAVLMAISALFFVIRMQIEEEMLIDEFGDAYLDYKSHTNRLVPSVY